MRTNLLLFSYITVLIAALAYWLFMALSYENPCDPSNEGTDYWYEVCMNDNEHEQGEPIIIQLDDSIEEWHI